MKSKAEIESEIEYAVERGHLASRINSHHTVVRMDARVRALKWVLEGDA